MTYANDQAKGDERWYERQELLAGAVCCVCGKALPIERKRGPLPKYCHGQRCRNAAFRERRAQEVLANRTAVSVGPPNAVDAVQCCANVEETHS